MPGLLRGIDRLCNGVALIGAMALLALMSVITLWQVITRFVLEQPSTWSEVTARSLMIWMVYLGLAATLRSGALIAIEVLMDRVPAGLRKPLMVSIAAITLWVLSVMVWFGWSMAVRVSPQVIAGVTNPLTGESISIALVYAAIPVGAALSIIAVLARLAEDLARPAPVHLLPTD